MSEVVYALNLTPTNVVIRSGYIEIAQGQYAALSKSEAGMFEVQYAVRNGWIKLSALEPNSLDVPAVEIAKITNPIQGMTAEELQEELSNSKPEPTTTVTALGNSSETIGEPTVTKLGENSTVEVNPAEETVESEPVKRTTRKTKAA
jgi:hypothetical protein